MTKIKDEKYPFRRGRVKKPAEKRIQKLRGRSLSSFNVLYCYATMLWQLESLVATLAFVGSVIAHFFMPQYLRKIKLARYPVKHVDHELDQKVPFKPSLVKCYLDFVNIWIRPIAMLLHRFGIFAGAKLGAEFLRYIRHTYDSAWKIYRISMTTTHRPKTENAVLKRVQKADPHYMCIPSLHIAVVCLCFSFYKMLFERENFLSEEKELWNKELYTGAVRIAETVLYVKQHSVNCIPAALYMLTRIIPELFKPEDAVNFIDALFTDATDITKEDKASINAHIQFMYERFLLEGFTEKDWTAPILRWLNEYTPYGN